MMQCKEGHIRGALAGAEEPIGNTRSLLYLSNRNDHFPLRQLGKDWRLRVARDPVQALELIKREDFFVGLVDTDFFVEKDLSRDWERVYSSSGTVEWIALLRREVQQDEEVIRTVRHCCFDFHTVPIDPGRLLCTVGHAYGMAKMASEAHSPKAGQRETLLLGKSSATDAVLRQLGKAARANAPVLIIGESGTGKELAARALHLESPRACGPFVVVDCGAMAPNLIQSELFGYEKGAFTGAIQRKIGRIESANGGMIFLDEIGDLSLELQTNLLRFLQEGAIHRVGGHQSVGVDTRVVAATHVDLQRAVAEGRFREDLYYRLHVLQIDMPPLRDRGADIQLLAHHFFERYAKDGNPALRGFSQAAIEALHIHTWPGNVRELRNRIWRAVVMSESRLITPEDLGLPLAEPDKTDHLKAARSDAERAAISCALKNSGNNMSVAAARLDISRATLYRLIKRHQLS